MSRFYLWLASSMRDEDFYWLAGLLEGEGSFMKPAPSQPNQPIISLHMADEDIVARVAGLVGLKYRPVRNRHPEKWRDTYILQVRGSRAVELMTRLRPFMGQRRRSQIDHALESYNPELSDRRKRSFPSSEDLRVMLRTETTRQLAKRLGCSRQTISRRSRLGVAEYQISP